NIPANQGVSPPAKNECEIKFEVDIHREPLLRDRSKWTNGTIYMSEIVASLEPTHPLHLLYNKTQIRYDFGSTYYNFCQLRMQPRNSLPSLLRVMEMKIFPQACLRAIVLVGLLLKMSVALFILRIIGLMVFAFSAPVVYDAYLAYLSLKPCHTHVVMKWKMRAECWNRAGCHDMDDESAVVGVFIVNVFFYLFNSIFVLVDILDSPWTRRFKVQDDKKPSFSKYIEALRLVLFNQFVTGVIVTTFFHYPMKLAGVSFDKKLPEVTTVLAQIVVCVFIEEIGFYYSHRPVETETPYALSRKRAQDGANRGSYSLWLTCDHTLDLGLHSHYVDNLLPFRIPLPIPAISRSSRLSPQSVRHELL
ncbi:hypothetical protein TELCIR_05604, partial [Teladorsagia circumcincta]